MPETIPAPYNFAPVGNHVALLRNDEIPKCDIPFRDGLSGEITVEFQATRPIYIRAEGHHDKNAIQAAIEASHGDPSAAEEEPLKSYAQFYRLPDEQFALPGTSIKGMLRSVLEVISFSRMFGVQDNRFAVRDLNPKQPNIFKEWMTKSTPEGFAAKPMAGWLHLDQEKNWRLQPCHHARIEHKLLNGIRKYAASKNSHENYEGWEKKLDVFLKFQRAPWEVVSIPSQTAKGNLAMSYIEKVESTSSDSCQTAGTLVFTGCPTRKKHREFVFERFDAKADDPMIPEEFHRDFLFLYEGQTDWEKFWKKRFLARQPVPVFYLATDSPNPTSSSVSATFKDGGHLQSLGLCQMHRLAYAKRVHDLLPPLHKSTSGMDIAEAVFGRVNEKKDTESLRGRIRIEPFVACSPCEELPAHFAVLNGPKASYYPNYLKQKTDQAGTVESYHTYHDDDAELRGWKRYPIREDSPEARPLPNDPPPNDAGKRNYKVATVFRPLKAGATFKGKIRFHNLRPWELGGLLWALCLGHAGAPANNKRRHSIGMAKPLGCGTLQLTSLDPKVHSISRQSESIDLRRLMEVFEKFVLEHVGEDFSEKNFRELPQVQALMSMAATDKLGNPADLAYPEHVKEFAEFKKANLVLLPFISSSPSPSFPKDPNLKKSKPDPPRDPTMATAPASVEMPPENVVVEEEPPKIVVVTITGQNKKGRWQAAVEDRPKVESGLIEGEIPEGITLVIGNTYSAIVLSEVPSQWKFQIVNP